MLATPEKYFQHLERRFGKTLPVRRGEWGGDWDLLRATEPVWSWRLRTAMAKVTAATPDAAKIALVAAMDHNVGLGPRWMDGLSREIAMRHVREVAALYRSAVTGVLGEKGAASVPAPLARPVTPVAGTVAHHRRRCAGGRASPRRRAGFPASDDR